MHRPVPVLVLALLLAACEGGPAPSGACEDGSGTQVRFDPGLGRLDTAPETWLAFPFPSDHRRTPDGAPSWRGFPNPDGSDLVEAYLDLAETEVDGFSTAAPVWLLFDGPLGRTSLPTDPEAFLSPEAPLQLVDVTPGSPEYGLRRPLRWELWTTPGKFVAANTLAVAPAWGFPLREATTYALVVTDDVKDAAGRPLVTPPLLARLLGGDDACLPAEARRTPSEDLARIFAPLRTLLADEGLAPWRVAAATVFTTQHVTRDLEAIRGQIAAAPAPAYQDDGWQPVGQDGALSSLHGFQWTSTERAGFWVMEGRFDAPNYQEGTVPYAAAGGGFHLVDGVPAPVREESLRFVLTIPQGSPPDGGPCWPLVEYAHGTGGDAYGFTYQTAGRFAGRGLAGISIDQPLHGPRAEGRSFPVELMTFNVTNLASARTIMRQSAVDTFTLTRFVRASLHVPAAKSPTGQDVCFDPGRVAFFGHSQGGLSGSLAAAFEGDASPWVLSGSGGGISITIMERKDEYVDFEAVLTSLLDLPEGALSESHPVVGLAQTLIDVTDPLNYAPLWSARPPASRPGPQSLLMTSGLQDAATPYRTAIAEAVAGRVPLVTPAAVPIPEYDLLGLPPVSPPVSGDLEGATAGFLQWKAADHFVVFDLPEAIDATQRFLQTAAYDGAPIIERHPNADVR